MKAGLNGVTFGLLPYFYCAGEAIGEKLEGKPTHQRDSACVEKRKRKRAQQYERHKNLSTTFDFVGSLTSPRLLWKLLARQTAKRSLGSLTVAMLDEGLQAAIYEYTWTPKSSGYPNPEVINGVVQGMVIGGGVHLLLGR